LAITIEKPMVSVGNSKAIIIPEWYMKMRSFKKVKLEIYNKRIVLRPIFEKS